MYSSNYIEFQSKDTEELLDSILSCARESSYSQAKACR